MPRHGSSSRPHLPWLEPASADALSPMQLLVIWLSRHYATYADSNTKGEMMKELCQGMRDAGYPGCTVHAIRSKIDSLRREARRIGNYRRSRAFQQYQQSLTTIFAVEGQHEDADEETQVKMERIVQDGSMNASICIADEGRVNIHSGSRLPTPNCALDVTEIRRRFELLCARHSLEEEGVAMEMIDRMLPLP